jgi:hypothetical protein
MLLHLSIILSPKIYQVKCLFLVYSRAEKEKNQLIIEIDSIQAMNDSLQKAKVCISN